MTLKILKVLLYKNFLIRKRQWKSCLFFEILLPFLFVFGLWKLKDELDLPGAGKIEPEQAYEAQKLDYQQIPVGVLYAPNDGLYKNVMDNFRDCATPPRGQPTNPGRVQGFATEEQVLSYRASLPGPSRPKPVVVIFKPINASKSFNYKIRYERINWIELYGKPFEEIFMYDYIDIYSQNSILQTQVCLDWSYMKTFDNSIEFNQKMYTQKIPSLKRYTTGEIDKLLYIKIFPGLVLVIFGISLLSETSRASSEKFLGVHVLMAMNGVSNTMNLISWLLSGVIFVFIFVALPMIVTFSIWGNLPPLFAFGNTFIIVLTFFLYVIHLLIFGIHISAYFKRAILVTFGLLTVNFGSMIFIYYDVISKVFIPYLGIIFPSLLFTRALQEIELYEIHKVGMQWKLLFQIGDQEYGFAGCLGMVLILFVIGIIFNFLMAIYIYEINPGQYGTSKHPLFFIQQFLNKPTISHAAEEIERIDTRLFEEVNQEIYRPGIQIRNLKKTYDLGVFNQSKVHALKGVSIDFYKGQITSLLGHNGAGKTTMMSILTGMTSPTAGSVLVDSKDLKHHANEIMNDMGLCTQENMVFPNLSVGEQLLIFAMLKGGKKSKDMMDQNIRTMLHKIKLYEKRNALPSDLSGGQKRRLCLGMALAGDSNFLILDEPTSGLDPENRRVIWDILLKLKGSKTILISTHDMEEADILGDRIAILHGGELRSYGTSFFLKKILGEGNVEVTLSVDPWCEKSTILQEFDSDPKIINEDGGKIVLSIKSSPNLPDVLDKIEAKKADLGITGLSVSLLTLEQVFLKVTEDEDSRAGQAFDGIKRDINEKNTLQILRGLLYKKITYTQKNMSSMMGMLFYVILSILWLILIIKQKWIQDEPQFKEFQVQLDMYYEAVTFYKSNDPNFGPLYDKVTQSFYGTSNEIKDSNISKALLEYGHENPNSYNRHVVAAAEINSTNSYNFLYSESLGFSLPVSVNLISNALLKSRATSDDYSIGLSYQALSGRTQNDNYYPYNAVHYISAAFVLVFTFFPAIALFVCHPLREALTGIKHLQRITGASCLTYWGSIFVFDLIIYFIVIILMMSSLVITDKVMDLRVFYTKEICISLLMFGMLGICSLPFIYNFSFMNKPTNTTVRAIVYLTIGLVFIDFIGWSLSLVLRDYKILGALLKVKKPLFLLFPQISFLHGGVKFFSTLMLNARCRKLPDKFYNSSLCSESFSSRDICCEFDCHGGECKNYRPYFDRDDRFKGDQIDILMQEEYSLVESLIYQFFTAILYFIILGIFETKLIQQLIAKTKNAEKFENPNDEQVNREKIAVAEKIAELTGNNLTTVSTNSSVNIHENLLSGNQRDNYMFLVYELQKRYGNLVAVKDISFKVNQQECFGLLGVNGAGKSTTFRMMTGGEVLDHGTMFIGDKEFQHNKNFFLSRMGYCPQNDALIKSLNSYDHLRLFARLRSIPEDEIEHEVNLWIQRLNLKACARQPSGTYSGGNKRRLNIAIALIGIPDIVLMDEPTTGVDPGARRSLWSVIQSCQATGQAVILTSHSMEECEALCNRLAIMVDGRFVCIGASQELKQRFGTDYNIQIKINAEKTKDQVDSLSNDQSFGLKQDIEKLLDASVADENLGYIMYHVKPNQTSWRKMYDVMNSMKNKYECIDDFSVSSSTLEQLFLLFAKSAQNRTS